MPKAQFTRFSLAALNVQSGSIIGEPWLDEFGQTKKANIGRKDTRKIAPNIEKMEETENYE